jgi:hypothetical protein
VRAVRLAIASGPPNALERVPRFVIGHPHDAGEIQRARGSAEQEMLRHEANPSSGSDLAIAVEIERQLDYIPGDDHDDGAQSRCCGLGAGHRVNGDRLRLRKNTDSGPLLAFPGAGVAALPVYPHPLTRSALAPGARPSVTMTTSSWRFCI